MKIATEVFKKLFASPECFTDIHWKIRKGAYMWALMRIYAYFKFFTPISSPSSVPFTTFHFQRMRLKDIFKDKEKAEDVLTGLPCFTTTFQNPWWIFKIQSGFSLSLCLGVHIFSKKDGKDEQLQELSWTKVSQNAFKFHSLVCHEKSSENPYMFFSYC